VSGRVIGPVRGDGMGGGDPTALGLPRAAAAALEASGFNLAGCLGIAAYDEIAPAGWRSERLLPAAGSAILLGTGGRALGHALDAAPEPADAQNPVDSFTLKTVAVLVEALRDAGHETRSFSYAELRGSDGALSDSGEFISMIALAGRAGLGVTGRLGILLHPEYGPWFAVRVLLLSTLVLRETAMDASFDPCAGCPKPCADACLGAAFPQGALDVGLCFDARERVSACQSSCAARRACVLGVEHGYEPKQEAYFMRRARESARSWRAKAAID